MIKYYLFPTPEDAVCQIMHDSGWNGLAVPGNSPEGRMGQVFTPPAELPNNMGAELRISAEGYTPMSLRGIFMWGADERAFMFCDDFRLQNSQPAPQPEPTPPPVDTNDPEAIIKWTYSNTGADLTTHDGCGKFTEDCCEQLHDFNNSAWGHIRKQPGQNQYNGHAVDAIQCLTGQYNGIWDIVHDSVSPNASPAFNHKGPADPSLWYYPA